VLARVANHLRGTTTAAYPLDGSAAEAVRSADLVVNATPVGMSLDDPSPVPASWLREGQVVLDMLYQRPETPLLRAAAQAGARGVGGLGMLVAQGALAIDIWAGGEIAQVRTPRDVMRAAAQTALETLSAGAGGSDES
jgi:shikimate dehydrogenase